MKLPIPHNRILFAFLAIFTAPIMTGTTSAGWVWKPAPQMMGGMYQAPAMGGMYPAPMMGGMFQAPGMRGMQPAPMMGRTYQTPAMGGMYRAPMMGGMYQAPAMGAMQGFTMNNQQRMYSGNNFRIIQETWTPPVD